MEAQDAAARAAAGDEGAEEEVQLVAGHVAEAHVEDAGVLGGLVLEDGAAVVEGRGQHGASAPDRAAA